MEPERSLKLSIWEGALSILFLNWSTGVLLTGYALILGASPGALAVLGGLPFLAQLLAPWPWGLGGSWEAWGRAGLPGSAPSQAPTTCPSWPPRP